MLILLGVKLNVNVYIQRNRITLVLDHNIRIPSRSERNTFSFVEIFNMYKIGYVEHSDNNGDIK